MDHAPGPIIANVAPSVANMMGIQAPALEHATQTSTTAINVPQTGVHRPRNRNIPAPAPITCGTIKANCEDSLRCPNHEHNRTVAVTTRCRRRPRPGQLFGNVEKRRCKITLRVQLRTLATGSTGPNEGLHLLLLGELQLDNSALQADRDSMSSVLGVELGEYVRDVAFHAGFADRQLIGNLFV